MPFCIGTIFPIFVIPEYCHVINIHRWIFDTFYPHSAYKQSHTGLQLDHEAFEQLLALQAAWTDAGHPAQTNAPNPAPELRINPRL